MIKRFDKAGTTEVMRFLLTRKEQKKQTIQPFVNERPPLNLRKS